MARLRPRPLGIDARPDDRAALGRDDDGRDAVLRPGALPRGAVRPVTPEPSIILLDSCNENLPEKRIHQSYTSRPGGMPRRASCCPGRNAAAPRSRRASRVESGTNPRVWGTRAGSALLFSGFYLHSNVQRYT